MAQGARPVGNLTTAFDTYPGLEQFSVIIDNYGIADGNYFYFNLPSIPPLLHAGADQRALPLLISQGNKNTVRVAVDLPSDFRKILIAPKSEDFRGRCRDGAPDHADNATAGCVITDEI